MTLSRRQFTRDLAAGLALMPLTLRGAARAQSATPQRLVFITSLGIAYDDWKPTSAFGAPVVLGKAATGLQPALGKLMLLGNLPGSQPGESHGSAQHTTGLSFGDTGRKTSVETYIAQALSPRTKLPSMLLGACAKSGSNFWQNGNLLPTIDSPLDAFNGAFGAVASTPTAGGSAIPRSRILTTVQQDLAELTGTVGAAEAQKLALHRAALTQLQASITATTKAPPTTAPNLMGQDPGNTASTSLMGALHMQLIPSLFATDTTRIVGLQWGTTNAQMINVGSETNTDEHSNVHSLPYADDNLCLQDNYLAGLFATLVNQLGSTADPLSPGDTLLDNTMLVWTRDIGDGPSHTQAAVPTVLAGATKYLKYNGSGGTYVNMTGQGNTCNLLFNMIEAMGAPIGNFATPGSGSQVTSRAGLASIKL